MRTFISIGFPEEINKQLEEITAALKYSARHGSFTLPGNFHITLAFLGELSPSQVILAQTALRQIQIAPFFIRFGALGVWHRADGDLYWLGIRENSALQQLQKQVAFSLVKQGFTLEQRSFFPHLTLGRRVEIQDQSVVDRIRQEMIPSEKISIKQVVLMESRRVDGKLCYLPRDYVSFPEG